MNAIQTQLVECMRAYIDGQPARDLTGGFDGDIWDAFYRLSWSHKLTAVVYDTLPSGSAMPARLREEWRKNALCISANQTVSNRRFLELCGALEQKGLTFLVFKGAMLSSLYSKPDLRVSYDNDLLAAPGDYEGCAEEMERFGLRCTDPDKQTPLYYESESGLKVELHRRLFEESDPNSPLFTDIFDRTAEYELGGIKLRAPEPGTHLLYLYIHSLKHFLAGGFGLRLLGDIAIFTRSYRTAINSERLRDTLRAAGCLYYAQCLGELCRRLFGVEPLFELLRGTEFAQTAERMLEDIMEAGIYGGDTGDREHTRNIIKLRQRGKSFPLLRTAFPPLQTMRKRYPYLKKAPILLPATWAARLFDYARDNFSGRLHLNNTLELSKKRTRLIRDCGLMNAGDQNAGKRRVIDTVMFTERLNAVIDAGGSMPLIVTGGSMAPFLGGRRDTVILSAPDGCCKKGDIALFRRENGSYVLHRVYKCRDEGIYFLGDAQTVPEGPISPDRIAASVKTVIRKGKTLTPKSTVWRFYAVFWPRTRAFRAFISGVRSKGDRS